MTKSVLFPSPLKLLQIVFPTIIRQVGNIDFVQEGPLDLQCSTNILASCVVDNVSKYLDILTLEVSIIVERPPF